MKSSDLKYPQTNNKQLEDSENMLRTQYSNLEDVF